jgi:hypothetical protein
MGTDTVIPSRPTRSWNHRLKTARNHDCNPRAGGLLFADAFALMVHHGPHLFNERQCSSSSSATTGRADNGERAIYTIVAHLPIEADGRIRYRIKSKTENFECVVTEDQIVGKLDALLFHY